MVFVVHQVLAADHVVQHPAPANAISAFRSRSAVSSAFLSRPSRSTSSSSNGTSETVQAAPSTRYSAASASAARSRSCEAYSSGEQRLWCEDRPQFVERGGERDVVRKLLPYAATVSCAADEDDMAAASAVGSASCMLDTFSAPSDGMIVA